MVLSDRQPRPEELKTEPELLQVALEASKALAAPASNSYKVRAEDAAIVAAAASSADVPIMLRNKLYAALGRWLEKPDVPPPVLARWAEDQNSASAKFLFLKEFVADPTWGQMKVLQRHEMSKDSYQHAEMMWATRLQVELQYKAHKSEANKAYVDKMLRKAQQKPHPEFPKDKQMMLYRVMNFMVEGTKNNDHHSKGYEITSDVSTAAAADMIGAAMDKGSKQFNNIAFDALENSPGKVKKTSKNKNKNDGSPTSIPKAKPAKKLKTMVQTLLEKSAAKLFETEKVVAQKTATGRQLNMLKEAGKDLQSAHDQLKKIVLKGNYTDTDAAAAAAIKSADEAVSGHTDIMKIINKKVKESPAKEVPAT